MVAASSLVSSAYFPPERDEPLRGPAWFLLVSTPDKALQIDFPAPPHPSSGRLSLARLSSGHHPAFRAPVQRPETGV